MSKQHQWISHENYVLRDASNLMDCFLLENGSWLDNLYLTALCSLATVAMGNPIKPETHKWLHDNLVAANNKTIRQLLKDKYVILGIFLGTNVIIKKSPDFLRQIKPLLTKLATSLEKVDWNEDPEFPAMILYSLAGTDMNLTDAKRYLVKNVELSWKRGRKRSAIYSFLGLIQFQEGRIVAANLFKSMSLFEDPDESLSKLDLGSIAVLLLAVSEIQDKHKYILYESLEQDLRSEFSHIRDAVLKILFFELNKAVLHEKSILTGKDEAINSIRYHPHNSDIVTVEVPLDVARKLFETPHLSDIALSIMAIRASSFETLYSFDKKTFETKCKPALKPSDYIPVERAHLLYFLIYTALGVVGVAVVSYVLSKEIWVSVLSTLFFSVFSLRFARSYFSQLISCALKSKIEEEDQ